MIACSARDSQSLAADRCGSLLIPHQRHDRSLRAKAARLGHRSLMSRTHATAHSVARRVWERATSAAPQSTSRSTSRANDDAGTTAMRLLHDLEVALSRWIGAEGYRALLLNAARLTLPAHPALSAVVTVDGFRATTPHAATAPTDAIGSGVVALLEVLMKLLGRIVGDEMAVRLVDQAGAPRSSDDLARYREKRHPPRKR